MSSTRRADSVGNHLVLGITARIDPVVVVVESATKGFPQILRLASLAWDIYPIE